MKGYSCETDSKLEMGFGWKGTCDDLEIFSLIFFNPFKIQNGEPVTGNFFS